jgi:hypothetical protein
MATSHESAFARLRQSAQLCSQFNFAAFSSCWADAAAAQQPVCQHVRTEFDADTSTFVMHIGLLLGSSLASQLHGWWPDSAPLQLSLRATDAAGSSSGFTPEVISVTRADDESIHDGLLRRECTASLSWLLDDARRCVGDWVQLSSAQHSDRPNLFIWIAAHVAFALKHRIGYYSCVSSRPLAAFSPIPCALEADVHVQHHHLEQAALDSGSHGLCLCDALAGFQVRRATMSLAPNSSYHPPS